TTDEYVAFRHIFAGTFDTMYLDDIAWEAIPACEAPLNAVISSYDDISATVSWTNNATNSTASSVEYGPVGFAIGTGTTVVGGVDSAMLTGLMPNTVYDVYVQQDCGMTDGLSTSVGPISFTTFPSGPAGLTCTSPGATSSSIFTEDFATIGSWTGDVATTGNQTWRFGEVGTTGSSNTGPSDAQDAGGVYAYFESSSNPNTVSTATMVSPAIDLTTALDDVEVTFWMHAYGATIGTLNVRLSSTTDFSMSPVAFTTTGQLQTDELDPWNQIGINAASFIGGNLYVQFEYTYDGSDFTSDFAIDELAVNTCFTCANVTAVTLDAVTSDSATISWTENNAPPATLWEVLAVPAGDPAPSVGTSNATTNPYTITMLSPETAYDIYVRTDCSMSFVGPITATTDCAVIVPDALETFDTFIPNCWEEASDGDLTTGPTGLGSGEWGSEEFAHASTTGGGAVNINLYNLGTSDWLLSPVYDLSTGGYELNVDVAVTAYNSTSAIAMGSDDQVLLLYTEDGTTWNTLETWDVNNTPSEMGMTYNNPLTGLTSATTQFAFYGTEGTVDDAEDFDFHLDNFQLRAPPSCPDTA
ncbi:fibronectin type III domain-containing protein, partial [Nonlabens mediterrranea]|nr:fibronectin type III domain-containing protein [Nonlabens mediterrranea]